MIEAALLKLLREMLFRPHPSRKISKPQMSKYRMCFNVVSTMRLNMECVYHTYFYISSHDLISHVTHTGFRDKRIRCTTRGFNSIRTN